MTSIHDPVAIGGGGGSGTRVIADILKTKGYDIGNDLNNSTDNLLFTLLFRRPIWYAETAEHTDERIKALQLFEYYSGKSHKPPFSGTGLLMEAVKEHSLHHAHLKFPRSLMWSLARVKRINTHCNPNITLWGWKEPNSHIYLPEIASHNPNIKYVHVIRHGLDIAYSCNQMQLKNWHSLFGITDKQIRNNKPDASLKYWIVSNNRAISIGKGLLGNNFHLLNFEELCKRPDDIISKLFTFLGQDVDDSEIARFAEYIATPPTQGRYKQHDYESTFEHADIEEVFKLGFSI